MSENNAAQSVDLDLDSRIPENENNDQAEATAEPDLSTSQDDSGIELDPLVRKNQQLLNEKKKEQARRRQIEEEAKKLKQQIKDHEEAKLKEQNKYEELYKSTKQELEEFKDSVHQEKSALVKREKRLAVMKELGKLKKESYAEFIDFDGVVVEEDGTFNEDSIKLVANKFRADYPELLISGKGSALNNAAPSSNAQISQKKTSAKELTAAEKREIRRSAVRKAT